jgi:tripartite-type tricarboxylate transporter receptor subunit TctC
VKRIFPPLVALTAVLAGTAVFAQAYPAKPIRFIVPFAAGGGNDNVARLVGKRLADSLGQPVVIDNRPGAGGVLGAELAAKAAPDGYTLFLGGVGSHAINPNLHERLPYDPIKDFAPIVLLASAPLILVVHPSVPADSIREFIALARSKPGQLNYASNGNGSSSHLAAVMFDVMAGASMVHVPYKGGAPMMIDLVGGQVNVMFVSAPQAIPQVKAGRIKALAIGSPRRIAQLPETPTVAETLPGFAAQSWVGALVPAGTPPDAVARLHRELSAALGDAEVRGKLVAQGFDVVGSTPGEFLAFARTESEKWAKVIRDYRIRVE